MQGCEIGGDTSQEDDHQSQDGTGDDKNEDQDDQP